MAGGSAARPTVMIGMKAIEMPAARNGLAIIRCAVLFRLPCAGNGIRCVPYEIFSSALASASGSPLRRAPSVSAWNSRLRLIAIWMIIAASGPKMTIRIAITMKVSGRSSATRTIQVI